MNGWLIHTASRPAPIAQQGGFCGPRWCPDRADLGGSGLPLLPSVQDRTLTTPRASSFSTQEVSKGTEGSTSRVSTDYVWTPLSRAGRAAWEVMSFLSLRSDISRSWKAPRGNGGRGGWTDKVFFKASSGLEDGRFPGQGEGVV